MKRYLLLILLPAIICSQTSTGIKGVWQDSDVLGSGWSNSFLFYDNGSFKFFFSQMDCAKKIVSYSGKWKINSDTLRLTVKEMTTIKGGKLVASEGSCAGDSMITGGWLAKLKIDPPEKLLFPLSKVTSEDPDGTKREVLIIDNKKYWRFTDDPDGLINQFEF